MLKDILSLIGPKRRNQMLALIPLMLLASLLEIAGLTMVVSVCAALADSAWVGENPVMVWLRAALHIGSEASLVTVILLALIALYAFKLLYLAWENYMVAKFVRTTRHEMSTRLCQRIVHSPYPFFTRHSTAELQNLLGQDTLQFSSGLNAYMQIFMEALVVLGMGVCLLLIDPAMTLFLTAGIASLTVLIRVILMRPIRSASQRQRDANRRRWKWLHHIVGGIKDIKTGRHEDYFAGHFAEARSAPAPIICGSFGPSCPHCSSRASWCSPCCCISFSSCVPENSWWIICPAFPLWRGRRCAFCRRAAGSIPA